MESLDGGAGFPPPRRGSEVESPTLPLPPPRDAEALAAFIEVLAGLPRDRVEDIREAIHAIEDRESFAQLLHEELFDLPCQDAGRHLILLSTIGELRASSSLAALERFVWLDDSDVFGAAVERVFGPCDFAPIGMLQARAAEMFMWVAGGVESDQALRMIRDHPLRPVRAAAIDSYLFNREDSPEAIEFLSGQVRPDERSLVGLPRRAFGTEPEVFDRQLAEHGQQFREDIELPVRRKGANDVP